MVARSLNEACRAGHLFTSEVQQAVQALLPLAFECGVLRQRVSATGATVRAIAAVLHCCIEGQDVTQRAAELAPHGYKTCTRELECVATRIVAAGGASALLAASTLASAEQRHT